MCELECNLQNQSKIKNKNTHLQEQKVRTQHLKGMWCKVNSRVLKESIARGLIERKKERSEILRYFQLNILRIATTTGHLRHCDCLPLSHLHPTAQPYSSPSANPSYSSPAHPLQKTQPPYQSKPTTDSTNHRTRLPF